VLKEQTPARVAIHVGCVGLVVFGLAALAGCGSVEVVLGLRTRLDKVPISALSATLSPQPGLSPGDSGQLVITATTTDGKQLVTVGPGHGTVLFDSFSFVATVVTVSNKGIVSLPADPRISEGTVPHVRITAIAHMDVSAELDIPVRYDVAFVAHFSGQAGAKGLDGSNGFNGMDGTPGSIDLTNPSAGGTGTDGGNGGDGDNGWPGQPGDAVHIWVTLKTGEHPLLQIRAAGNKREQFFLVDPNGGSLTVDANGGPGGGGGSGGRGGRGGSGGSWADSGGSDRISGPDLVTGARRRSPGRAGAARTEHDEFVGCA
jgi:hypothetical protein